jgi:methylmalonyl-CoA mutase cobalamin-binding subunit
MELGQVVPIQPELPAVGSPASFENTLLALRAGVDTLGNFANFVLRFPYWDDEVEQLVSVLRAIGAIAAYKRDGVVLDSYLEDGFSGTFFDYRSVVGWARFERYIVEELCGAAYAPDFGGLTSDPLQRAAVIVALEQGRPKGSSPSAYYHGDTVGYTDSEPNNLALFVNDTLLNIAVQMQFRTGAALLPVPLTERQRIPSVDEIYEVHRLARALEPHGKGLADLIDWSSTRKSGLRIAEGGDRWFKRLILYLQEIGIDISDPFELMLATRRMGRSAVESIGLGPEPDYESPTELSVMAIGALRQEVSKVSGASEVRLDGTAVAIASSDVHEFAKFVLEGVLRDRGAQTLDCGISVDPEALVSRAAANGCSAVVVTTHNGWALNFGRRLAAERDRLKLGVTLVMGGVLNEDVDGTPTPRDVGAELRALGIVTTNDPVELVRLLAKSRPRSRT